jgi:hypothetical protein
MGFLAFLRRERRTQLANPGELREGPPSPEFLGEVLAFAFLVDRFGLSGKAMKRFVKPLPNSVKASAPLWINLYLCWLFRQEVRSRYGDPFFDLAFAATRSRLAKSEDTRDYADVLDFVFKKLDMGVPAVPDLYPSFEFFAAYVFLGLYFGLKKAPDTVVLDLVTKALAEAKEDRLQAIRFRVELGGPVDKKEVEKRVGPVSWASKEDIANLLGISTSRDD